MTAVSSFFLDEKLLTLPLLRRHACLLHHRQGFYGYHCSVNRGCDRIADTIRSSERFASAISLAREARLVPPFCQTLAESGRGGGRSDDPKIPKEISYVGVSMSCLYYIQDCLFQHPGSSTSPALGQRAVQKLTLTQSCCPAPFSAHGKYAIQGIKAGIILT